MTLALLMSGSEVFFCCCCCLCPCLWWWTILAEPNCGPLLLSLFSPSPKLQCKAQGKRACLLSIATSWIRTKPRWHSYRPDLMRTEDSITHACVLQSLHLFSGYPCNAWETVSHLSPSLTAPRPLPRHCPHHHVLSLFISDSWKNIWNQWIGQVCSPHGIIGGGGDEGSIY